MLKSFDKGKAILYTINADFWQINCRGAKEGEKMSIVRVGENENIDSAVRRFKRKCSRDGILGDLRKKEFYESPAVKRRKKSEAARKRSIKG